MLAVPNNLKEMYETDYLEWLETTVNLLKQNQLNQLDIENLIEELTDLGKQEKRRATSFLEQIIIHLLLYQYWETRREENSNHWQAEIVSFRSQLNKDLTTNIRNLLTETLALIYVDAWRYAQAKTKLKDLPQDCPYTLEQLLDINWYPEV